MVYLLSYFARYIILEDSSLRLCKNVPELRGIKDIHFAKEGKASLIYSLLDEILVEEQELEEYESSQSWLAFDWGNLEETSQLILVRADSLFEEFNKIPESDYSSLILEYFRSLEIELFFKIFHPYAEDVRRKNSLSKKTSQRI